MLIQNTFLLLVWAVLWKEVRTDQWLFHLLSTGPASGSAAGDGRPQGVILGVTESRTSLCAVHLNN